MSTLSDVLLNIGDNLLSGLDKATSVEKEDYRKLNNKQKNKVDEYRETLEQAKDKYDTLRDGFSNKDISDITVQEKSDDVAIRKDIRTNICIIEDEVSKPIDSSCREELLSVVYKDIEKRRLDCHTELSIQVRPDITTILYSVDNNNYRISYDPQTVIIEVDKEYLMLEEMF